MSATLKKTNTTVLTAIITRYSTVCSMHILFIIFLFIFIVGTKVDIYKNIYTEGINKCASRC